MVGVQSLLRRQVEEEARRLCLHLAEVIASAALAIGRDLRPLSRVLERKWNSRALVKRKTQALQALAECCWLLMATRDEKKEAKARSLAGGSPLLAASLEGKLT